MKPLSLRQWGLLALFCFTQIVTGSIFSLQAAFFPAEVLDAKILKLFD
jgi:hypothetical protein